MTASISEPQVAHKEKPTGPLHQVCQRCYPAGNNDFILTLCGELRDEQSRVKELDVIFNTRGCISCKVQRKTHYRECRADTDQVL